MPSSLTFLFPWILTALAVVPVLWWLLRVMPPRAKTIKFPAFFLLKGLTTKQKSAAHTPWWLLLLRCLVAIFFIFAFAEPVLHPAENLPGGTKGNVLIVIDNGWASAAHWQSRIDKLRDTLQQIRRSGRPVIFLPTAPTDEDGHVHSYGPMEPAQADEWLNRLKPQPWPTEHEETSAEAQKILNEQKVTYAVFFSDGITESQQQSQHLLKLVQTVVTDDNVNNPVIIRQTDDKTYSLERLHSEAQDKPLQVVAYTSENNIADELKINFPAGQTEQDFSWNMLPEVRNKTTRLGLREPAMASAVFLANAQWRQHPVGIIADSTQKENRNFLSEVYYLRRALEADSQLTIDKLDMLLKMQVSALILPDSTALTASEKDDLLKWVQDGGFLIRFAGPHLAAAGEDDPLLPVPLRSGQRAMEGAMTWEKPVHLGEISQQSPLYGLPVPQDTTVTRQVLADPTPEVFEKTWLQLEDGTPLVTGSKMDKGTLVLVHTTAGPDWSNFCYSGLFVEALQRMVSLSNGISNYKAQTTLPPLLLLDGFGKLSAPDSKTLTTPLTPGQDFTPSPQTPPGLYGSAQEFSAFNLGEALPPMKALKDIPAAVTVETYQKTDEVDLKPILLKWALLLLLADTLATLRLRGVMMFLALMLCAAPAQAMEDPVNLVSGLYLAYIETGDQDIDRTSYNGMTGLGDVISARTTAKVKGVVALNPDSDNLVFYPVIYWPMAERQENLSLTAANNIQNYLSQGGIILFDTRDRQFGGSDTGATQSSTPGARKLRELTQSLEIPELMEIPRDHILTRSFYLMDDFPGRYDGGKMWVEKEPSPRHDGITSVIIGANDWAAAWSKDANDQARFMIEPGGERQREMAYRFGVNLVMVALTGNYKADQIHTPYILERLGR
jgi:hypothetical protein